MICYYHIGIENAALQATYLQGIFMYAPQEPPAVYSSALASSVIIMAATPGPLSGVRVYGYSEHRILPHKIQSRAAKQA